MHKTSAPLTANGLTMNVRDIWHCLGQQFARNSC